MKTTQTQAKHVEWLSAERMHKASQDWLSELNFIKDEQYFFQDLIKSYTLQLIRQKSFPESKEIVSHLNTLQKQNNTLSKAIKVHENELQNMIDGENQQEKKYKNKHRELTILINTYLKDYRMFKTQLFKAIKSIMKKEKQERLLP